MNPPNALCTTTGPGPIGGFGDCATAAIEKLRKRIKTTFLTHARAGIPALLLMIPGSSRIAAGLRFVRHKQGIDLNRGQCHMQVRDLSKVFHVQPGSNHPALRLTIPSVKCYKSWSCCHESSLGVCSQPRHFGASACAAIVVAAHLVVIRRG